MRNGNASDEKRKQDFTVKQICWKHKITPDKAQHFFPALKTLDFAFEKI